MVDGRAQVTAAVGGATARAVGVFAGQDDYRATTRPLWSAVSPVTPSAPHLCYQELSVFFNQTRHLGAGLMVLIPDAYAARSVAKNPCEPSAKNARHVNVRTDTNVYNACAGSVQVVASEITAGRGTAGLPAQLRWSHVIDGENAMILLPGTVCPGLLSGRRRSR